MTIDKENIRAAAIKFLEGTEDKLAGIRARREERDKRLGLKELNKGYEFTKAQIAELESLRAWKAELEKQEPVAYFYEADQFTWMQCWPSWSGAKPLYAAPVVSPLSSTSETDVEKLKADYQAIADMDNSQIKSLSREIQSLKTELEAAWKDAERYRWLKENGSANSKQSTKARIYKDDSRRIAILDFAYWCDKSELDAAIEQTSSCNELHEKGGA